jgi:hypothetical protein
MESRPSWIRYTPMTMVVRLTICCTHSAPFDEVAASSRSRAPTLATSAALFSHLAWMTDSAPSALTVSRPIRPSTRVALRCALAR